MLLIKSRLFENHDNIQTLLFFLAEMCERHVISYQHQIKLFARDEYDRRRYPECGQQKASCY